jgi:heme exporter protein D
MDWMIWVAIGCCVVAFAIDMVLLIKEICFLRKIEYEIEREESRQARWDRATRDVRDI